MKMKNCLKPEGNYYKMEGKVSHIKSNIWNGMVIVIQLFNNFWSEDEYKMRGFDWQ